MPVTRRKFLTLLGGSSAAAVIFNACGIPDQELLVQSPVKMPEDLVTGVDNWYATLCNHCQTSEGLIVRVVEGRAKKIEGNPDYPLNVGKHGAKCEAMLQALYHPDRLDRPKLRNKTTNELQDISWEKAFALLTQQLKQQQDSGNADKVVFATNIAQGHQGMIVDKFVRSYGAEQISYETIEETVYKRAIKEVFNQDLLPDLDIANSKYILSFGADFLETWGSPTRYARGYGLFRDGERGKLVHISSRFSLTAANADEWIFVNPGTEGILALSIAHVIIDEGLGNSTAGKQMTNGKLELYLQEFAPPNASKITGVSIDKIKTIAQEFAKSKPSLAIGGGTAGAYTNGLYNLKSILALNYLVGSVNKEGGVIFNPPPALPNISGNQNSTPFSDWERFTQRITTGNPSSINVLIFRGINPAYGLPDSLRFKSALKQVPFIVSFTSFIDETASVADLVLPEHNQLESWGNDIPNPGPGYQVIGFQQPVVRPFFEQQESLGYGTRDFSEVLLSLAGKLGLKEQLPWDSVKDLLISEAKKLHNKGNGSVKSRSFSGFWNGILQRGGWWDTNGKSKNKRPKTPLAANSVALPSFDGPTGANTFHLIPFASLSISDGSGAHLPWLQSTPDPISTAVWQTWVEINIRVADKMGIREGDVIEIQSSQGSIRALAYPHPAVSPDVVGIPMGQGHTNFGQYASNRGSNVMSILAPKVDQDTGALAWASTRVSIKKTGEWIRLPKFEGSVPAIQTEDRKIIEITNHS